MNTKIELERSNVEITCCGCSNNIGKGDLCALLYLPSNTSIILCEECGRRHNANVEDESKKIEKKSMDI